MTQEALKLALEALEQLVARFDCEKFTSICELEPAKDAITAIKEALAQTQDRQCKRCTDGCPACDARKLQKEAHDLL